MTAIFLKFCNNNFNKLQKICRFRRSFSTVHPLLAISPIDGRYRNKTEKLSKIFSEFGLIRNRVFTEIKWIKKLSTLSKTNEQIPVLSKNGENELKNIAENFSLKDAEEVKLIETKIKHDVKAVEYYLRNKFCKSEFLKPFDQYIHLFCTSEDITNVSYALSLKESREILIDRKSVILAQLEEMAFKYKDLAMISRTHGQAASPTTLGKEIAVFANRLNKQLSIFKKIPISAKFNGAVGNFNAHRLSIPNVDWINFTKEFIENDLELNCTYLTTQIEPNDMVSVYLDCLKRFNNILIDFCQDIWNYCMLGYFNQKANSDEIGSSTMPHKVNPIDFENCEGNLGISNSILTFISSKIQISRLQRDLSGSTVMRNLGPSIAHSLIAFESLLNGLTKLNPNFVKIKKDLEDNWILLAEPIQSVMRMENIENSYEELKKLTRGKEVSKREIKNFIAKLDITSENKKKLLNLTPENYVGYASKLAEIK